MKIFTLLFLACVLIGALASLLIEGEPQPDALRGGKYGEVCGKPENGLMCGLREKKR